MLKFFIRTEVARQFNYVIIIDPFQINYSFPSSVLRPTAYLLCQYMLRLSLMTFLPSPALAAGTKYPQPSPILASVTLREGGMDFLKG